MNFRISMNRKKHSPKPRSCQKSLDSLDGSAAPLCLADCETRSAFCLRAAHLSQEMVDGASVMYLYIIDFMIRYYIEHLSCNVLLLKTFLDYQWPDTNNLLFNSARFHNPQICMDLQSYKKFKMGALEFPPLARQQHWWTTTFSIATTTFSIGGWVWHQFSQFSLSTCSLRSKRKRIHKTWKDMKSHYKTWKHMKLTSPQWTFIRCIFGVFRLFVLGLSCKGRSITGATWEIYSWFELSWADLRWFEARTILTTQNNQKADCYTKCENMRSSTRRTSDQTKKDIL